MSTQHSGNILNEITREEHDGANNAKRVTLVGNVSITAVSQMTVTPLQAWPDPKGFIGLVTVGGITPGTGAADLGKAEDAAHTSGDVGVMDLGVVNSGATIVFSSTDGDYVPKSLDQNGRVYVVQKSPTATLANITGSAAPVTLFSANAARIGAVLTNESSSAIFIKFGANATTTSYTVSLSGTTIAPYSYYEVPAGYTGRVDAFWSTATGVARVTELT